MTQKVLEQLIIRIWSLYTNISIVPWSLRHSPVLETAQCPEPLDHHLTVSEDI